MVKLYAMRHEPIYLSHQRKMVGWFLFDKTGVLKVPIFGGSNLMLECMVILDGFSVCKNNTKTRWWFPWCLLLIYPYLGIGLPLGKWSNFTSLFFNLVETTNQIMIVHFQGIGTTSPHRRTTNRLVLHACFNSFNIPVSCLVKQCEIWSISILTTTTGKRPWFMKCYARGRITCPTDVKRNAFSQPSWNVHVSFLEIKCAHIFLPKKEIFPDPQRRFQ